MKSKTLTSVAIFLTFQPNRFLKRIQCFNALLPLLLLHLKFLQDWFYHWVEI